MEITPYIDFKLHTCVQLKKNFNALPQTQQSNILSSLSNHKKIALQTALQLPEITHRIIRFITFDDEQTALLFSTMPFAQALLRLCRIEEIFKSSDNFHLLLQKNRKLALSAYFYFGPQDTKTLIGVEKATRLISIPGKMYETLEKHNFMSEYLESMLIGLYPVLSVCDSHAIPMPENPEDRFNLHDWCVIT